MVVSREKHYLLFYSKIDFMFLYRNKGEVNVYRVVVDVLDSLMGCDLGNICAKAERKSSENCK
jgi:hypothetical protein